ncbi:hypothetical protein SLEP1_g45918 [Rubroshorea leprosula]|uniref:Uncharacterized protein n=1 Tax=Rubroshorea leprosula TaxID=152421 RepID=A0AAV5LKJ5_9ROSI|nr:hypothetical protein SLEP1_g45918 [Rubroshorea leprosula]
MGKLNANTNFKVSSFLQPPFFTNPSVELFPSDSNVGTSNELYNASPHALTSSTEDDLLTGNALDNSEPSSTSSYVSPVNVAFDIVEFANELVVSSSSHPNWVTANFFSIRDQLLLVDSDGKPIFTPQRRILSMHDRWETYKGESTEDADFLFTVKKSAMVQMKKKPQVFLAKNTNEYACDYRVEGSFLQDSRTVYVGETNNIVARMYKKLSFENLVGKERGPADFN